MELADGILHGERRPIARGISLVEDEPDSAQGLLAALYPHTGRAHVVGITGAPGTGKSTLVNALAKAYRQRGQTVGIIAVDPTSPFSGGALLGDRIRMRDLAGDSGIFVRSMATRGSLGGLARAARNAIRVLDAAGMERILVETVGVGQAEVDIAQAAHTVVVLEAPNMGDDIQVLKAGLIEIADILVVNKADREGAERAAADLEAMLDLGPWRGESEGMWRPPVLKTTATRGEGIEPLLGYIERHGELIRETGEWERVELDQVARELIEMTQEALLTRFRERIDSQELATIIARVVRRELDPYSAMTALLAEAEIEPTRLDSSLEDTHVNRSQGPPTRH